MTTHAASLSSIPGSGIFLPQVRAHLHLDFSFWPEAEISVRSALGKIACGHPPLSVSVSCLRPDVGFLCIAPTRSSTGGMLLMSAQGHQCRSHDIDILFTCKSSADTARQSRLTSARSSHLRWSDLIAFFWGDALGRVKMRTGKSSYKKVPQQSFC
jgi:hypothetical protein